MIFTASSEMTVYRYARKLADGLAQKQGDNRGNFCFRVIGKLSPFVL
jgi:hypothetical protein